jgi:hypothetical protein
MIEPFGIAAEMRSLSDTLDADDKDSCGVFARVPNSESNGVEGVVEMSLIVPGVNARPIAFALIAGVAFETSTSFFERK